MENFKIELYKNEGLKNFKNNYFPPHFLLAIVGKPGSGKTTLLKKILRNNDFFYKKFNKIFIITPSKKEFNELYLPIENMIDTIDMNWINSKIKVVLNEANESKEYKNILFIFDDVLTELNENKNNTDILKFIFNRRHKLDDKGMISIIITSQKFNKIPTAVRSNINEIIFFKLNPIDYKQMQDDIIYSSKECFELVIDKLNEESLYSNFIIYRIDINKFFFNFNEITFE